MGKTDVIDSIKKSVWSVRISLRSFWKKKITFYLGISNQNFNKLLWLVRKFTYTYIFELTTQLNETWKTLYPRVNDIFLCNSFNYLNMVEKYIREIHLKKVF